MSGVDVAEVLETTHPDVPIIGFTARPDGPMAVQLASVPAVRAMLTKPVDPHELLNVVKAAADRSLTVTRKSSRSTGPRS